MTSADRGSDPDAPIFVSTLFKSGTKLLEEIVRRVSGKDVCEPPPWSAPPVYTDSSPIVLTEDSFFIWHNVISEEVSQLLLKKNAKVILLVRNIYDLVVSQYYHFSQDVDEEVGLSTETRKFFKDFSKSEGLSLVINGIYAADFTFDGVGAALAQINSFLDFKNNHECLIVQYEDLVLRKLETIDKIAVFLGSPPPYDVILKEAILKETALNEMREQRASVHGSGAHFRNGVPGAHFTELERYHYLNIQAAITRDFPGITGKAEKVGSDLIFSQGEI